MKVVLKKKILNVSKDLFYNILASLIITGVMQVIVYPFLAQKFSATEYGMILTVIGVANTIMVAFGNTLNNVRLIVNCDYEKDNLSGDFNLLVIISSFIALLVSIFINSMYFNISKTSICILTLFVVLGIVRTYYSVEFRLILNFKKILVQNLIGTIGYLIGIVCLKIINMWPIPFLVSEFFQLVYVIKNNSLCRESYKVTSRFQFTLIKYIILIITGLSTTLIAYLDRLIIYPLLGGNAVTIYTVASFFGKSLGVLMTPIAGVLLGYYAQKSFVMTKKRFWLINLTSLLGGLIFVIFSIVFAPFFTKLLYPTIYTQARSYILIANLAATINVVCSLTQSSVLKFAPTWLQIVKEVIYGTTYIGVGCILLKSYGLLGFCIAAVIANSVKLIVLYIVGTLFVGFNVSSIQQSAL